jgi:fucose permease
MAPVESASSSALTQRWPRIAVTSVFVVHGLLFASWTAHIPHVKTSLGLTDGTLGFALLGAPVGSVCAMVASAHLLPRLGSRRIVQIALVGYCATGPLVGLTGSLPALLGALFIWGAFQGSLDVAMNTQAITVERAGRPVLMSGLHGSWSIGAFAGAGIGALAVGAGITLSSQLLILGSLSVLSAGWLTTRMLPDRADPLREARAVDDAGRRQPMVSRWSGGMALLGAIAFASMLCEGASANWAAVYMVGPLHTTGVEAGLGYATFAFGMVVIRLSGNRLLTRYRADRLLPTLAALATVGFTVGLLIGRPIAALAGFTCLGVGLASVVPAVYSAAGRITGLHPGTAVATAAACGWAGFVCGPPLIGRLASQFSLPAALILLPALTGFIVIATAMARALKPQCGSNGRAITAGSSP